MSIVKALNELSGKEATTIEKAIKNLEPGGGGGGDVFTFTYEFERNFYSDTRSRTDYALTSSNPTSEIKEYIQEGKPFSILIKETTKHYQSEGGAPSGQPDETIFWRLNTYGYYTEYGTFSIQAYLSAKASDNIDTLRFDEKFFNASESNAWLTERTLYAPLASN